MKKSTLRIMAGVSALTLSACGQTPQETSKTFNVAACEEANFSRENPGVAMVMDTDNRRPAAFVHCYGGDFDKNAVIYDPNVRNVGFLDVAARMGLKPQ